MSTAVSAESGSGAPPAGGGPTVAVREVVKHFRKPNGQIYPALGPVSFNVPAGTCLAIVGPSGCGKSPLLHMVAGESRPTAGEVWVNGVPVRG